MKLLVLKCLAITGLLYHEHMAVEIIHDLNRLRVIHITHKSPYIFDAFL